LIVFDPISIAAMTPFSEPPIFAIDTVLVPIDVRR
jgi:hypothetical protein